MLQGKYLFLTKSKKVIGEMNVSSSNNLEVNNLSTLLSWKCDQPTVSGTPFRTIVLLKSPHTNFIMFMCFFVFQLNSILYIFAFSDSVFVFVFYSKFLWRF